MFDEILIERTKGQAIVSATVDELFPDIEVRLPAEDFQVARRLADQVNVCGDIRVRVVFGRQDISIRFFDRDETDIFEVTLTPQEVK